MVDASRIREHMEVVGSDGQHVGTVDHVVGDREIKLTRRDEAAGGQHHYIPLDWVSDVGAQVRLTKAAAEARQHWRAGDSAEGAGDGGGTRA